jgi:hypothetical protein
MLLQETARLTLCRAACADHNRRAVVFVFLLVLLSLLTLPCLADP